MTDDPFAPIPAATSTAPDGATTEKKKPASKPIAVHPGVHPPMTVHPALGKASAQWLYRETATRVLMVQSRFDPPTGKQYRVQAPFSDSGSIRWEWRGLPAGERPLYRRDDLAARPGAVVLVCEGEKSADSAAKLAPDLVATTSPNGATNARHADWSPLVGRHVVVWPDRDKPGRTYATDVTRHALAAGALSVKVLAPPPGPDDGWDAANALAEGMDPQAVHAMIDAAMPQATAAGDHAATAGEASTGELGKPPRQPRVTSEQIVALAHAGGLKFWVDRNEVTYAALALCGRTQNVRVRSTAFRKWMAKASLAATGKVPGAQTLADALNIFEALGDDEASVDPWLRVGVDAKGVHYLDLSRDDGSVVKLTGRGWDVVSGDGLPFIRTKTHRPLPTPEGGDVRGVDRLRPFINVASEDDFKLTLAFLVACLFLAGPHPILVLVGEQGTAKSTAAEMLKRLVDPTSPLHRNLPQDEREASVAATNAWLLSFDNVSRMTAEQSDTLCKLSTRAGFSYRKLHSDDEESTFDGGRPQILNGITPTSNAGDFNSRAIIVRLAPIPPDKRRPKQDIDAEFEAEIPFILGALLDAASTAIRLRPGLTLSELPRMADFARLGEAMAPAFNWEAGEFLHAYKRSIAGGDAASFESDIVAREVLAWLNAAHPQGFDGTVTLILEELNTRLGPDRIRSFGKGWPPQANAMGARLDRAGPAMRARGWHMEVKHSGTRTRSFTPIGLVEADDAL